MKRFFAFGCSYTSYFYPTWADFIGSNFDEYYNYGQAGSGNRYIFNSIIEANIIHKFTKDDVIFIQWSGVERTDKHINNVWKLQVHQNRNYMTEWLHFKDKLLELMNYITILKDLFDVKGISYKFLMLTNIDADYNTFTKENCLEVKDFYKDTVSLLYPGFHDVLTDNRDRPVTIAGKKITDGHHFPWEQYDYVEKFFPEYLPKISNLREKLIEIYEQAIDIDLDEIDQNVAFERCEWPIKIRGVRLAHNKFSLLHPPKQIIKDKNNE